MVSSMARGRILLYLLFIAIVPSTSLPECPDQGQTVRKINAMMIIITVTFIHTADVITFVSQPRDIESVCRADDVASFPCQAGTSVQPQWMINGTRHSSVTVHQLPDHKYSDHVLTVTNLRSKNGSLYQCLLISSSEGCAYISSEAQLICKGISYWQKY